MATYVWVAGSASWGDLAAWSPEGTPSALDTAIFDSTAVVSATSGDTVGFLQLTTLAEGVTLDGMLSAGAAMLGNVLVILPASTLAAGSVTSDVGITIQGSLSDTGLDNVGAISLAGTWSGPFTNEASGVIGVDGTYNGAGLADSNLGVVDVGGTFIAGVLDNAGTMAVTGTLTGPSGPAIVGAIVDNSGGTLTANHGSIDLGGLTEGGGAVGGGAEASGTVSLVSSTATISDLAIGYNDLGASTASTLSMDLSTLDVSPAISGDLEPFVVGQGTLSLTHDSALSSEVSTWFGSQGPAAVTIDSSAVDCSATNDSLLIGGVSFGHTSAIGVVTLNDGAVMTANDVTIDVGSTIVGNGTLNVGPLSMNDSAVIASANGTLVVNGSSANTPGGTLAIGSGSTFELNGGDFAQSITYGASGGTLRLDLPGHSYGQFDGFGAGDTIVLTGVTVTSQTYNEAGSGGTLALGLGSGATADLAFAGGYSLGSFGIVAAGSDTDITAAAPCFAQGTPIATPDGMVPVEALRPGDVVLTACGAAVPVRWLGHRHVACGRHPRPDDVQPVRIVAHAFGAGRPTRDLLLSPDHAVFIEDVLIPIRYLLNGATVRQQGVASVTYWHVELPRHGVLLAAGLPCESYLDTGNRAAFANGGAVAMAHPDFARLAWAREGCAPLVTDGPARDRVYRQLLAQAFALGWRATDAGNGATAWIAPVATRRATAV